MTKVLSGGQLAGGNSVSEKADNDYYATDPKTVKLFLDRFNELKNFSGVIWEPACGEGNISEVLKDYFPRSTVISTDLVYRNYGEGNYNFLDSNYIDADLIITNPPFSLINDFILQALKLSKRYVIFLAKIQTLETLERKFILENSPLKYVYVHSSRQATWKNGNPLDENGKKWATTMCLAWFVWDKEYTGEPIIRFIGPSQSLQAANLFEE